MGYNIGEKNPNWKGGLRKKTTYDKRYSPNHPFAHKDGCIYEHRFVMENHLKRYLKPKEIVHHIDGNVKNNNIDNLELLSNLSSHSKYHRPKGCPRYKGNWGKNKNCKK